MKRLHKPTDEKRSIVVLQNSDFLTRLYANEEIALNLLKVPSVDFLVFSPSPLPNQI